MQDLVGVGVWIGIAAVVLLAAAPRLKRSVARWQLRRELRSYGRGRR